MTGQVQIWWAPWLLYPRRHVARVLESMEQVKRGQQVAHAAGHPTLVRRSPTERSNGTQGSGKVFKIPAWAKEGMMDAEAARSQPKPRPRPRVVNMRSSVFAMLRDHMGSSRRHQ